MSLRSLTAKILFCAVVIGGVWLGGLLWFAEQIPMRGEPMPDVPGKPAPPADAIVVLTGGKGRLDYGLRLLMQGRGNTLFISGVGKNLTLADLLHNVSPEVRAFAQSSAVPLIVLGHEATSTIGNALETSRWLKEKDYTRILLVTAAYHMPRSLEEFRQAMPQASIIPAPVFPDDFSFVSWWRSPISRERIMSEYHKYLASRLRHWYIASVHPAS